MTILLTGGSSQIGLVLAKLLKAADHSVLFASRSGLRIPQGFGSVKLDWYDLTTFANPFSGQDPIKVVYLLPPPGDTHCDKSVVPFIDLAITNGVKRFVLVSASGFRKDDVKVGISKIHRYLEAKGVEYVALRPTWFIEYQQPVRKKIREGSQIITSIPTGKISFVGVDDIAQAAFDAIVRAKIETNDVVIVGPESLSYGEVANVLTAVLGRKITHKVISPSEMTDFYVACSIPRDHSEELVRLEQGIEAGVDDSQVAGGKFTGRVTVKEWVEKNKAVFEIGKDGN